MILQRINVLGCVLCLFLIAACDRPRNERPIPRLEHSVSQFDLANEAIEEQAFQEAIELYSAMIDQYPEHAAAYARRGYAYYKAGDDQHALEDYRMAVDLDPSLPNAHAGRALFYAFSGERQQALQNARTALDNTPRDAETYQMLGKTYFLAEQYQQALEMYRLALDLDPNYAEAYTGQGLVYAALGDYQRALDDYYEALAIRPDATVYNNLAVIYDRLGHYAQAITDFRHAVEYDPQFVLGYANLGLAYANMWDFQHAETQCLKSLELDEYNCAGHYCLGRIYKVSGDIESLEQAFRHYTQVLEYGCDYFEKNYIANAYVHRGQVMSALGFPQTEVLADFQEAIRNDPQHTYAYVVLGDQNEGEDAIAYYSKAIELTPKYAVAYLKRSQTYRNQGNFQAALHDSEQANALAMTPVWKQEAARQIKELQDLLETASPETPPPAVETPVSPPIPSPIIEDIP